MRKAEIYLEFSPYIDQPPMAKDDLYRQSTSSDESTIRSWRPTWLNNIKANFKKFGPFSDMGIGQIYGKNALKPCIIAGSGPSLKKNVGELKNRGDMLLVSCLHNFHFLEDNEAPADYYVSLDAGEVVVEEVYEGGANAEDHYWNLSKDRTLLCYVGTSPRLLEKWQGKVLFFNCPIPDEHLMAEIQAVDSFNQWVSTGGNVLGATLYIAKGWLGSPIVAFVGADFSFSYDRKFHGWSSKYDKTMGHAIRTRDVFGVPVYTWGSYHNFKCWFDWVTMTVPGIYYNCTEGGTFGAYENGNIRSVIQTALSDFLRQMNMYKELEAQAKSPRIEEKKILF